MSRKYPVECPYCKHVNKINYDAGIGDTGSFVETCDCDDGGCDREFVVSPWVKVEFEIRAIKQEED